MKHVAWVAALAGLGTMRLMADTSISTFDNFSLDAKYENWAAPAAVLTSNPTNFEIQARGYGSGYKYLGQNINATGNNTVQFKATVNAGVAGFVIDISDSSNNGQQYAWYGLVPGGGTNGGNDYTLTLPIASGTFFQGTGVMDLSSISQMNIGIDPGASAGTPYDASFNDLSFITAPTPEPTTVAVAALGLLLTARRRR